VKSVVLDASAALAWLLPSQATEAASAFLGQVDATIFQAPAIFAWEVYNVLVGMVRRGLLTAEGYDKALLNYQRLNIQLHASAAGIEELALLARTTRLSLFDASYFALAVAEGWPLASRDEALLTVAVANGVECFDLRSAT
jgi:predicted nucleic acid-binding protein